MSPDADLRPVLAIRALLAPGEDVLWSGRPRQTSAGPQRPSGRLERIGGGVMAVAVLYLVLFHAPEPPLKNLPGFVLLGGILLAALGGFLRVRGWMRRDLRARTTYVLTRSRAYRHVAGIHEPPEVWDLGPDEPLPVLAVAENGDWALLFDAKPDPESPLHIWGDGFRDMAPDPGLLARLGVFGITQVPMIRYLGLADNG